MDKLNTINAKFDKNSIKVMLDNLKKGVQIGVLGAALTAGSVMGVGCSTGDEGGKTYDEDQTITTPGNNNGGNTGDNNGGNENEQPSKEYGTPYDRAIGRDGEYLLHNFMSDEDNIEDATIYEDLNHYLALGATHVEGMATKLQNMVNGRTNYFDQYINNINQNSRYFEIDHNLTRSNLDEAIDGISDAAAPIFADIIYNLDKNNQYKFYYAYRILANEAYREGAGYMRETTVGSMSFYENNKKEIIDDVPIFIEEIEDMGEIYKKDDFTPITDLTNGLLEIAANNISTRDNTEVRMEDLRQVFNLTMNTHSLLAMDRFNRSYEHNHLTNLSENLAMRRALTGNYQAQSTQEQDQGLSR
ncbi:MAG: hypothetical protein J1D88_06185 [Treponema sp.]|nr:hypothetical protein [Treponema sp.]